MKRTALDILDYAESLDPDEYLDVFLDIIDLYCEFNYLHKAIGICQKLSANENLEDKSVILMRMGILFSKMGDTTREIETYQKVLELNPNNKKARFRLSEIYETEGMFADALKILNQKEENTIFPASYRKKQTEQIADDEMGEEIYLSEDDETFLGKRQSADIYQIRPDYGSKNIEPEPLQMTTMKSQKVENLIKDIKNEDTLNVKTRRRMVNIVELNELFFSNVQQTIDQIMKKYNLDVLLLEFKQCELGIRSATTDEDFDFRCIKRALRLEQRKLAFRDSIYQLLLNESKGKIRSTFQGLDIEDTDFKKELNYLFIFKRKKNNEQESSKLESMFKESKNKSCVARKLSTKLVTKMKTIPDYIGNDKFVEIIDMALKLMYNTKRYLNLCQICDLLLKISKSFDGYPQFQVNFYFYGFLGNCKLDNYEKAYVFFRIIGRYLIANDFSQNPAAEKETRGEQQSSARDNEALRAAFRSHFGAYSQSEINKVCFCMMNHLFNEFYQQETSHRIFFQKFQKQYERIVGIDRFVNMICANNYIMSGSYPSAKEWLLRNNDLDSNPLSNFLMGFITLIESTNRNNENKIQTIHQAFEYFDKYQKLSPNSKLPEVYYNLGRAFSHLSMSSAALKMFAKSKSFVEDKILQTRQILASQAKALEKDIDENKWREFDAEYRKTHFYYESSFNEVVWNYKLNNRQISFSLIDDTFKTAN